MIIQRNPLGERRFGHAQRPVHHDAASGNPDRQPIAGGMAQVVELKIGDHITTHPHSVPEARPCRSATSAHLSLIPTASSPKKLRQKSPEIRSVLTVRTPFVSVYESADGESAFDDPIREAYSSLVDELYDEEFDEALFELLTDVRNMHQDQLASGTPSSEADHIVTQHVSRSSCGNRKRWWTRSGESSVRATTPG